MNILTFVVILIMLVSMMLGYHRGLLRTGFRLFSTILSLVMSYFFAPVVGDAIVRYTKVDDAIEQAIYTRIEQHAEEKIRQELNASLGAQGISVTDEMVQNAMSQELTKNQEIELLNELTMSETVRNGLIENNYDGAKEALGISGFYRYVAAYITRLAMRVLAYVLTFILVGLILLIADVFLKAALALPGLSTINRLAGLLLGLGQAILLTWVVLLLISLTGGTGAGASMYAQIGESPMLSFMQKHNLLLSFVDRLTRVLL